MWLDEETQAQTHTENVNSMTETEKHINQQTNYEGLEWIQFDLFLVKKIWPMSLLPSVCDFFSYKFSSFQPQSSNKQNWKWFNWRTECENECDGIFYIWMLSPCWTGNMSRLFPAVSPTSADTTSSLTTTFHRIGERNKGNVKLKPNKIFNDFRVYLYRIRFLFD